MRWKRRRKCVYLKNVAEELEVLVWPVRSPYEHNHLDELVPQEGRQGGRGGREGD